MSSLIFTVLGPPRPWQRAGSTPKGVRYTKKETLQYQKAVMLQCNVFMAQRMRQVGRHKWPLDARYGLRVAAYFADNRRRDLDNVIKSVCDAMNGHAYYDDSQIDEMTAVRLVDADNPRTEVILWTRDTPNQPPK